MGIAFSVLRDHSIPQIRVLSSEATRDAIDTINRFGRSPTRMAVVVESMTHGDRRVVLDSFRSLGLEVTPPSFRDVEHLSRDWPAAISQIVTAPIILPILALQRLMGRGQRIYFLSGFDWSALGRPPGGGGGGDPAGDRSPTRKPTGPPPLAATARIDLGE